MVHAFNNHKVGTRILIGYVIALVLMTAVNIVAVLRIQEINETVTNLADGLAAEQHLADRVVSNVWATHFYALQYMDQQNPVDLERYQVEYNNFNQLLSVADQYITKDDRLMHLENIRNGIATYGEDFAKVITLLSARNRELLIDLDQQGRLAEIKLEQIRANSFFADDAATSYQAGNAQRALLIMRVAAFQYLESGDDYWVDEFYRAYESAQTSFKKLDEATQSRVYQELTNDAEVAVETYVRSFDRVRDNYLQQQNVVAARLNVVGPMIREEGAAISTGVTSDFQIAAATTQLMANQTQWLLLLAMAAAIMAALAFAALITRSITEPLERVTEVARQIADRDLRKLASGMDAIAQGDLTRDLTISTRTLSIPSSDEIGQLARAFNAVIRQLQKTGSAFSEMATNLRALTERNDRLFAMAQTARLNAEAASRAKSHFLANMSHELRTPLNAILGHAQILNLDRNLTPSHLNSLYVIQESGRYLLTLINDILDLAKIEAGKLIIQPGPVHLPTMIESVARIMHLRARDKGLQYDYKIWPNLPAGVEVDEKRLRQVLINLLSNAIKFTPSGVVTLQAYALEEPSGNSLNPNGDGTTQKIRILVSDTGIGISPDHIDRIFESFEQFVPDSLAIEGTGLGLAISQRFIQAMGSTIRVDSKEGQGSTFYFDLTLPLVSIELPEKILDNRRPIGYKGARRRIMVIDDQQNSFALASDFLRMLGFDMVTIGSGQQNISQALQLKPDLVLVAPDTMVPTNPDDGMTESLRQYAIANQMVVFGLSDELVQSHSTAFGSNQYLSIPVDFDWLIQVLGERLQLTWLYEEVQAQNNGHNGIGRSDQLDGIIPPAPDDLIDLYDLAMKGNMPGIYRRAAEIKQEDQEFQPFIDRVQKLAKAYDEESILNFLGPYLDRADV